MRIRHLVCTDNFAGVERYAATTSVELARRGHDVEVVGGDAAAMGPLLAESGVTFIDAPSARAALRATRRRPRPDLVHAHMTAADLVALATKPWHRAPVVSTLHFAQPRGHDLITRTLYAAIPRLVTAEIAISQFVAETAGGFPTVIANGVPEPTVDVADMPPRAPVVLVAQRFESEKATELTLHAFAISGLATQGWELHLAGRGSEAASLERLAERLDIAASTRFLGHVAALDTHLATASIFLASAPAEPFGLSVVEAMAAGLPVIAAAGGAQLETIRTATPETLFPTGDADAAAALLRHYAEDPVARADLAERVRDRYTEAFTIESHVDALEAFYDRTIARGRHR